MIDAKKAKRQRRLALAQVALPEARCWCELHDTVLRISPDGQNWSFYRLTRQPWRNEKSLAQWWPGTGKMMGRSRQTALVGH
jgi:hypothetical protein